MVGLEEGGEQNHSPHRGQQGGESRVDGSEVAGGGVAGEGVVGGGMVEDALDKRRDKVC